MNIEGNIQRALFGYLEGFTPSKPVKLVFPTESYKPSGKLYARITNLRNAPQRLTINNGGIHLIQGILQVVFVWMPVGGGVRPDAALYDLAGELVEYFKSGTEIKSHGLDIRVQTRPAVASMDINADRTELPVSINWQLFN